MPTKRKFQKKRRTFKRKPRKQTFANETSVGVGIPDRVFAKLKYTDVINATPSTPTHLYQFNINSLFDPNLTGTGHQPMLFDQWTTLYNRYKVHGCKWRVRISGLPAQARSVVFPSNESGAPADITDASENKYAKVAYVDHLSSSSKVLTGYISMRKLYGRKELENKDEAAMGADPAEVAVLNIFTRQLNGANIANINLEVDLMYYAEVFDRKNVIGS